MARVGLSEAGSGDGSICEVGRVLAEFVGALSNQGGRHLEQYLAGSRTGLVPWPAGVLPDVVDDGRHVVTATWQVAKDLIGGGLPQRGEPLGQQNDELTAALAELADVAIDAPEPGVVGLSKQGRCEHCRLLHQRHVGHRWRTFPTLHGSKVHTAFHP
jgi:hypothetical protein